ncbi:hypothetical protein YC2023_052996 [Brassica napus]
MIMLIEEEEKLQLSRTPLSLLYRSSLSTSPFSNACVSPSGVWPARLRECQGRRGLYILFLFFLFALDRLHLPLPDKLAFLEWSSRRPVGTSVARSCYLVEVALFRTCGEGSVKWSGLESVLGLWSDSYFPLSDLSGLRRGGAAAKGLVTAQFVGGEVEGGCNRGESVLLDSLCVCLWLSFDGSSMATRRSLDAPPLFQSSCSRRPVKFHSDSLVTASLEELSLLLFIVVTICWLRGCFVSGQGTGPLVLKGHGCVGGARESFTVSESASRQSSHPGAVVFYGGVVDFLAGFWDYFLGRGGGDHPSLYRLKAEASAYSIWEEVQASCGASFIPALVAFARHCYSGNVKGTPGIRENEENLTFPRVTLMVENNYRYRRISKNNLTECAGFSG